VAVVPPVAVLPPVDAPVSGTDIEVFRAHAADSNNSRSALIGAILRQ
jgi:hypothetical protein